MSEMVEMVARAIFRAEHSDQLYAEDSHWRACEPAARAAIEAMREPTEAMLTLRPTRGKIRSREDWQSMIDAALGPAQPQPESPNNG